MPSSSKNTKRPAASSSRFPPRTDGKLRRMAMTETVLEQSEKLDGTIVQTVRLDDGREVQREYRYTCSICGAVDNDHPFPTSAISCMRRGCKL